MSNTLVIEAQLMFDSLKEIDDPKEALEKLASLECQMGWGIHPERARAIAYGIWLTEKRPDWYPYFEQMITFLAQVGTGQVVNIETLVSIEQAPEGWIAPVDYLKGKVVE